MTNLFSLGWNDAVKGLVMAVLGAVISYVYNSLGTGPVDWNQVLQVAIASGLGYIIKNYFTDSEGKLLGKL